MGHLWVVFRRALSYLEEELHLGSDLLLPPNAGPSETRVEDPVIVAHLASYQVV